MTVNAIDFAVNVDIFTPDEKMQCTGSTLCITSGIVKPFLKWAGGKKQLLPIINKFIPINYERYYEPFVGAGSVVFSIQPKKALISDINEELINCYKVIKENPEELLLLCDKHKKNHSKDYYYKVRKQDRNDDFTNLSSIEKAARIIYLNKTCFNGLFRVNKNGQFNVPFGKYVNPCIADHAVIKAVSVYLNQADVTIVHGSFENVLNKAKKNDFIYLDPPYHPISDASFTAYTANNFCKEDQVKLRNLANELSDKGCHILISNSDCSFIRSLYDDNRYKIIEVKANRAINSVASKRGKINELLIYNKYKCKQQKN